MIQQGGICCCAGNRTAGHLPCCRLAITKERSGLQARRHSGRRRPRARTLDGQASTVALPGRQHPSSAHARRLMRHAAQHQSQSQRAGRATPPLPTATHTAAPTHPFRQHPSQWTARLDTPLGAPSAANESTTLQQHPLAVRARAPVQQACAALHRKQSQGMVGRPTASGRVHGRSRPSLEKNTP